MPVPFPTVNYGFPDSPKSPKPVSSFDSALTAFAQLGALRLNAKISTISLILDSHQYILAEATRTLSLQSDDVHEPGDGLIYGFSYMPRAFTACVFTADLPLQPTGSVSLNNVVIINDLSQEERFKHHESVMGPPRCRFYAGVPIVTSSGVSIGTYCVVDDKPRDGLGDREQEFLQAMAKTVMHHLETVDAKKQLLRSECMVRGIGDFIEGKATIYDKDTTQAKNEPQSVELVSSTHSEATPVENARKEDSALSKHNELFGRASAILKEVMDIDGAVFFDVKDTASFRGKDTEKNGRRSRTESTSNFPLTRLVASKNGSSSQNERSCAVLGHSTSDSSSIHGGQPPSHLMCLSESLLEQLLERYPAGRVFTSITVPTSMEGVQVPLEDHAILEDETLFIEDGAVAREEVHKLLKIAKHARHICLLPIWDFRTEKWLALAMIYTRDPHRVLTTELELKYLAAFGNSLTSEISRLNSERSDQSKTDFISSISHELR